MTMRGSEGCATSDPVDASRMRRRRRPRPPSEERTVLTDGGEVDDRGERCGDRDGSDEHDDSQDRLGQPSDQNCDRNDDYPCTSQANAIREGTR
jgi:hypothetical protein